jgi:hypothetical protein
VAMFFFCMGIRNPSTYMVVSPWLVTHSRTAGAHFDTPRQLFSSSASNAAFCSVVVA